MIMWTSPPRRATPSLRRSGRFAMGPRAGPHNREGHINRQRGAWASGDARPAGRAPTPTTEERVVIVGALLTEGLLSPWLGMVALLLFVGAAPRYRARQSRPGTAAAKPASAPAASCQATPRAPRLKRKDGIIESLATAARNRLGASTQAVLTGLAEGVRRPRAAPGLWLGLALLDDPPGSPNNERLPPSGPRGLPLESAATTLPWRLTSYWIGRAKERPLESSR